MIRLQCVDKVYRTDKIETLALNNINLEILEGEFVSVMGPSGCGKSTLLNIMGLLDVPTQGTVQLNGSPILARKDKVLAKIRNQEVGFIFQTFHLISDLTVVDNVEIPLLYRRLPGSKRRQRALRALDRVGLSSRLHHFPSQLSGGQQQRVAIARASQMGDEIMDILMSLNRDEKTTIVMVTHDPRLAGMTRRIIRLFDGRQVN